MNIAYVLFNVAKTSQYYKNLCPESQKRQTENKFALTFCQHQTKQMAELLKKKKKEEEAKLSV